MRKFLVLFFASFLVYSCGGGFNDDISPSFDGGVSQGGSLSRFTIVGDYLYLVNDYSLVPIDITNLDEPVKLEEIYLGFGIETIFPYEDHLFIGSNSAVYIYNIDDPATPQYRSIYDHATGCDPVVVSGNFAYVTLREGVSCSNFFELNVLEVLNVSDVRNPIQVNSINMTNPRGLALGCNNKLYVCEGDGGLVQFDVSIPSDPVYERTYDQYPAEDLIVRDDLLIVTGEEGVYQYQCASDSLMMLSFLPFSL
jgi:hypothetical protein